MQPPSPVPLISHGAVGLQTYNLQDTRLSSYSSKSHVYQCPVITLAQIYLQLRLYLTKASTTIVGSLAYFISAICSYI